MKNIRCFLVQCSFTETPHLLNTTTFFQPSKPALKEAVELRLGNDMLIGSDEEKALMLAIDSNFPASNYCLCTRHLKSGTKEYMQKKVGVPQKERITIAKKIFGKDGLVDANSTIEFEKKSKQKIKDSENYPAFISYFRKRLHPNIEAYIKDPDRQTKVGTNWTNNNCESINHVFKLDADWKTNTMPNMINLIHEIILLHFKDFKRSLYGEGNFRLHGKFRKQQIKPSIWRSLSSENRQEKFKIFLENKKTKGKYI